jgi:dCTP deaminase
MGTLADWQIYERCINGMVVPFEPELLGPASLDLRLGSNIMIESAESPEMVLLSIAGYTQENPYPIVPGQFFLAEAEPIFNIPQDLEGQFILKSSRAREGFQHLMAGFGDPGWHGSRLTLELKNVRQLHKIGIWPGLKIGQMKFSRMDATPRRSYAVTGRYNGDATVTVSKG